MKRVVCLFVILVLGCGPKVKNSVEACKVKRGEFNVEVVESGEIQAVKSVNIAAPAMSWRFGQLKITQLVEDGLDVAEGDTVILFDPSEVEKALINAQAEKEIAEAELEKLKAEQESKIHELEADLRMAEIAYEISKLELEKATYEPDIKKKEIQLNLDKAKISLEKAREEIENQKKIHTEEQHQSIVKIRQLESNVEDAQITLQNLTVVSPGSGVAIVRKKWGGDKWQVGDQPWSGIPLVDLPDLRSLKVETEINEVDISKIALDQKAEIRLDAFSDTVFTGKVIQIAALAKFKDEEKKSKIKIFPVEIFIDGTSEQLMPGMTVSCKIIVNQIPNVIYIPLEACQKEENEEFVYLKSGNSFKKKKVRVGISNNDYIIVEEGLDERDEVALLNPFVKENVIEN